MKSCVERIRQDLKFFRLWIPGFGVVVACFSFVAFVFFQTPQTEIVDSDAAGRQPVHLRALDPQASLVTEITSREQLARSVLDDPAVQVLLAEMAHDPAMYLTLPFSVMATAGEQEDGLLLIGAHPLAELPAPGAGEIVLLGAPEGSHTLGLQPVRSDEARPEHVCDGSGFVRDIGGEPLGILTTEDFATMGVLPPMGPSGIASSFTCLGCSLQKVEELAARMTQVDRQAGGMVTYHAVVPDDLRNPVSSYHDGASRMRHVQLLVAATATLLIAVVGTVQLWARRKAAYRIDLIAGSPVWQIHARTQVLLFLAVSLPTVAAPLGFMLLGRALSAEMTLTRAEVLVLCFTPVVVHVVLGVPLARQVRGLYKRSEE